MTENNPAQAPKNPITPEAFRSMVPSSRASPRKRGDLRSYTITVQRRERSGRWNQVASWIVMTDEADMQGPLAMGLKDNYRILVNEGKPPGEAAETNGADPHAT